MTTISRTHPRYRSLRVRHLLAEAARRGVVVPEGLIAHGRGEAFDYFLGERTTPSARRAERTAARWLATARHPVVSVNGNVAALGADRLARLVRACPRIRIEVNLFHRTGPRAAKIAAVLRRAGVTEVLGVHPTVRLRGLPSDRAWVDKDGIAQADVCLVPLEDGDRAEALRARGVRVISIDLNPLSRTSRVADLPIIDELGRALDQITRDLRRSPNPVLGRGRRFDAGAALGDALRSMELRLRRSATRRGARVPCGARPGRASAGRSRRGARRRRSPRRSPRRPRSPA